MGSREETLVKAIRACLTGDVQLCEEVFTRDVICTSPVLSTSTRDELETVLSSRRDALANIDLTIDRVVDVDVDVDVDAVTIAEWTAAADHAQPFVVPQDTRLDPSGKRLSLTGATFAEFTGTRISTIRHYFDEAGLLEQLAAG